MPERGILEQKFRIYNAANPNVKRRLAHRAIAYRSKWGPDKKLSIQLLIEGIRWKYTWDSGEEFKLNNNYSAFYARLLMLQYPVLKGMFNTRTQKVKATFG